MAFHQALLADMARHVTWHCVTYDDDDDDDDDGDGDGDGDHDDMMSVVTQ